MSKGRRRGGNRHVQHLSGRGHDAWKDLNEQAEREGPLSRPELRKIAKVVEDYCPEPLAWRRILLGAIKWAKSQEDKGNENHPSQIES